MADKPLKLALVGCGSYGLGAYGEFLKNYKQSHPDMLELTAACDYDMSRAQKAVDQFGFAAACDDVAAMIRDHKPQLCICALPKDETIMQGSQLLAQNMMCVLELPLGDTIDEVMEMADAAREMQTPHIVNLSRRFNPLIKAAAHYAKQAGAISLIECKIQHEGDNDNDAVLSWAAHGIDAIFTITGESGSHSASMQEDELIIQLGFRSGAAGQLNLIPKCSEPLEQYIIVGEKYRIEVELTGPNAPSFKAWRKEKLEIDITDPAAMPPGGYNGLNEILDGFFDAVTSTDKAITPTIDDATALIDTTCQISGVLSAD